MLPLLINRAAMVALVNLTATVTEDQLRAPINDAHSLDLPGLRLPTAFLEDLSALLPLPAAPTWAAGSTYAPEDVVTRGELRWRALVDVPAAGPVLPAEGAAATDGAEWALDLNGTLLGLYLQPWLCARAYGYYLMPAGLTNAAAGLVLHTDPNGTFQPVPANLRAQLLAENERRTSIYESRLRAFLSLYHAPLNLTTWYGPNHGRCAAPGRRGRGRVFGV